MVSFFQVQSATQHAVGQTGVTVFDCRIERRPKDGAKEAVKRSYERVPQAAVSPLSKNWGSRDSSQREHYDRWQTRRMLGLYHGNVTVVPAISCVRVCARKCARAHAYLVQSGVTVKVTQSDSLSTVPPRAILRPIATTKKKVTQYKQCCT